MRRSRLVFAPVLLAMSGCNVLLPAHSNSQADSGEVVYLVLKERQLEGTKMAAALAAAPAAVGAIVDLAQRALEDEAKEYTASYASEASSEFFNSPPGTTPNLIRLTGFDLVRMAEEAEVARFQFGVTSSSQGDAFQVSLKEVTLKRTKAKVFDLRWWTYFPLLFGGPVHLFSDAGDGAVDLKVEVDLEATWTDAAQTTHTEPVAHLEWTISDVSIQDDAEHWTPIPEGTSQIEAVEVDNAPEGTTTTVQLGTPYVSRWIPAVPVSRRRDGKAWGCGTYTIRVTVTESDDFAEYVSRAANELGDNREKIVEAVVRLIPAPEAEESDDSISGD